MADNKEFVKQIEAKGDAVKTGLKKSTTNEKTWKPTAADLKEDKEAK